MTNSNSKSLFNFFKEVFSSKDFFAAIGERVFGFIVGTATAILLILGIAWLIDKYNENKAKKEAKRRAEEEREDLRNLKEIYDAYFNSRIVNKTYKNLREIEEQFENKIWKEFRQVAKERMLTEKEFNNFRDKVIEFRKKLERVYNY